MTFPLSTALLSPLPAWFSSRARTLPWRAEDLARPHPDPYAVLVSEVMLQQTQVATVVPYFLRWMAAFPDAARLARAGDEDIHKLWEGLGYYRRARFLRAAAASIARDGWPSDLAGLMKLPGLGPYTAAAVASVAFLLPEPALDGNAFRVLARLLGLREDPRTRAEALRTWLRPALTALGPSHITQGLMELGATVCAPQPACSQCPLAPVCRAHGENLTRDIPPVRPRAAVRTIDLWLLAIHADNHWLLVKPAEKGLLAGLWRWPTVDEEDVMVPPGALEAASEKAGSSRAWKGWSQVYTHRKERVRPLLVECEAHFPAPASCAWIADERLPALPLGRRDQRLRSLLEQPGDADARAIPVKTLIERIQAQCL